MPILISGSWHINDSCQIGCQAADVFRLSNITKAIIAAIHVSNKNIPLLFRDRAINKHEMHDGDTDVPSCRAWSAGGSFESNLVKQPGLKLLMTSESVSVRSACALIRLIFDVASFRRPWSTMHFFITMFSVSIWQWPVRHTCSLSTLPCLLQLMLMRGGNTLWYDPPLAACLCLCLQDHGPNGKVFISR